MGRGPGPSGRPGMGSMGARPPISAPPPPPKPTVVPGKGPNIPDFTPSPDARPISLKPPIIVRDLAEKIGVKAYRILHDLMELGVFANLNQSIEERVAQYIAARHGFRFEVERREKGAGQVHAPVKKVELDVEESPCLPMTKPS